MQGLQEVTLLWSSVEFGWEGTCGASTRGQMAILDQVFVFDFKRDTQLSTVLCQFCEIMESWFHL